MSQVLRVSGQRARQLRTDAPTPSNIRAREREASYPPGMSTDETVAGVHSANDKAGDDQYFEWERPEITEHIPRGTRRVLDVGCGAGAMGAAIRRLHPDAEVIGIEYFPDAAERARARLDEVWQLDLNRLQPNDIAGTFDVITCGDVLEHLLDPAVALRTLRQVSDPDATLIISIPNIRHWSVLYPLIAHDRFTYEDAGLLDRTHVHFFTLTEMVLMLQECGWRQDHVGAITHPMPPEIDSLVSLAQILGAPEDARARLEAYQYILVCHPA